MKIALLYICTGIYNQFFEGFYSSAKKYLLKDKAVLDFFVWTDDDTLYKGASDVHVIHKKCEGFPADSLFRFRMFLQVRDVLSRYDYIYFFNANAEFLQPVEEEILPDSTGLVAALWPQNHKIFKYSSFFPYERNKKSLAYIPPFDGPYHYFMGGVNGGTSGAYLEMITTLYRNIEKDYRNGIVAIVHDESHLNKYLHQHSCKILKEDLAWPEEWNGVKSPKIIFREKTKFNDTFKKGRDKSLWGKFKFLLEKINLAIKWYL